MKEPNPTVYACKIINLAEVNNEEMSYIKKEIRFHSMVKSEFCVRLHNRIETKNHMYMIQDYCNGLDLAALLEIRK